MKKGFTLMEILFVLLVIALVVSFAVPAIRSVRYDVYNSRAKTALRKLAEARRSYYQQTKGSDITTGSFAASLAGTYAGQTCLDVAASGIPGSRTTSSVAQLFACGFLDWKDFDGLPYTFYICSLGTTSASAPCKSLDTTNSIVYVGALGNNDAGDKYKSASNYFMSIGMDMQVRDNLE